MQYILQLSDFHIKADMPDPKENDMFVKLIAALKKKGIIEPILVYNGDIIDSGYILENIPDNASVIEKKEYWKSEAQNAYKKAKQYFQYLERELCIVNDHIIIAIGNHDINRNDDIMETFSCPISEIKDIKYGRDRFELITEFFKESKYYYAESDNHFREIGDFNFIIANTQWINKKDPKVGALCFNCNSLENVFEKHKERLREIKNKFGKLHNIFVAHNPERDCCEYACFKYPENKYKCLENKIADECGIKLFGDKHTDSAYNHDYIVGAPLDSKVITYGLYTFSDNNDYCHTKIIFDAQKGDWTFQRESEAIKEILKYSFKYLKKKTFKYLNFDHEDDIDSVVNNIYEFSTVKLSDAWKNLDDLFSSFVSIQTPRPGQPGMRLAPDDRGLFNYVTRRIKDNPTDITLTIKGPATTGKSVFLTALYTNLLYEYCSDLFPYMPFYLDVDSLIDNTFITDGLKSDSVVERCIDDSSFCAEMENTIINFMESIREVTTKYGNNVLVIFDGIKQFRYYDNFDLENSINSLLTSYTRDGVIKTSIIGMDTNDNLNLEYTIFHRRRDSKYVAYFDSLLTYKVDLPNKFKRFIRAYYLLSNYEDTTIKMVTDNIVKLNVPVVDLNLLTSIGTKLLAEISISDENPDNIFYVYLLDYYNDKFKEFRDEKNVNNYAKICYYLYLEKNNYTAIKEMIPDIGYRQFDRIIRNELYAKTLIGINYCNQLKTESNSKPGSLHDYSKRVLNRLYGHELCTFILRYIYSKNWVKCLIDFEKNHYDDLAYTGKSTITYLIGRIITDSEQLETILNREEESLKTPKASKTINSKEYYEYRVARRSIFISRLAKGISDFLSPNRYFDLLLSDEYERRVNRQFYLQFYGDRKATHILPNHDVILNGLDFYNTYQIIGNRLSRWKEEGARSELLELELFTLCDLVQIRLDHPCVTHRIENNTIKKYEIKSKDIPDSFFFNKDYLEPPKDKALFVLDFMISHIDYYQKGLGSDEKLTKYNQYLEVRRKQFINAKNSIIGKKDIYQFNINDTFEILTNLATVKKTGWHIQDYDSKISESELQSILDDPKCYETTLEHVYECFLIGLLYLPKIVPNDSMYNKDRILKMILIHDLGESYIGDYPPSYVHYEDTRVEEDRVCFNLYLTGMHNQSANLIEYLDLWNEWYKNTQHKNESSINIRVAAEIDKIQMIYKMFKMLSQDEISLPPERIRNFYTAAERITTETGKHIFNTLIVKNTKFHKIAEKNGIDLKDL